MTEQKQGADAPRPAADRDADQRLADASPDEAEDVLFRADQGDTAWTRYMPLVLVAVIAVLAVSRWYAIRQQAGEPAPPPPAAQTQPAAASGPVPSEGEVSPDGAGPEDARRAAPE